MSECIKKDAVLSTIEAMFGYCTTYDLIEYKELMLEAVKVLPSADIPQGEWIDISEWYAPRQKCSICETVVDGYGSNFCPNCGAHMKGADDAL